MSPMTEIGSPAARSTNSPPPASKKDAAMQMSPRADAVLELCDSAGGERFGDDAPTLSVIGRIEVDDRGVGREEAHLLNQGDRRSR